MNTAKNGPAHGAISSPHDRLLSVDAELRFGQNAVITHTQGTGPKCEDPAHCDHPHRSGYGHRLCPPIADVQSPASNDNASLHAAVVGLVAGFNALLAAMRMIGAVPKE